MIPPDIVTKYSMGKLVVQEHIEHVPILMEVSDNVKGVDLLRMFCCYFPNLKCTLQPHVQELADI